MSAREREENFMNEPNQRFIYICVKLSTPQLLASTYTHNVENNGWKKSTSHSRSRNVVNGERERDEVKESD